MTAITSAPVLGMDQIPDYGLDILRQHAELLYSSAITAEAATARGYKSIQYLPHLRQVIPEDQHWSDRCRFPGLLIPLWGADGKPAGCQFRPDKPKETVQENGKTGKLKYENPVGQPNRIDVPPAARGVLGDPKVRLFITEGVRKADSATCHGYPCISVQGVCNWRGTNGHGGKVALPDWEAVALNGREVVLAFDSDVMSKRQVQAALRRFAAFLSARGARVRYLWLPDDGDGKCGLDDFIAGHGAAGLASNIQDDPPPLATPKLAGTVVRLSEVQSERVTWLWDGHLPLGKVVTLDGDPGLGKSTLAIDLAARVTTGSPMPDGTLPAKGAVLILSAEDGIADTIKPRLEAAGADCSQVVTITEVTGLDADGNPVTRPPCLPDDLPFIEEVAKENGVVLVVVDVLMAYLPGKVNAHRDQDVRRALHPVKEMAERAGCCVLVLRHLNKAQGISAIYRGGGSIGIVGAGRGAFLVAADPDDETGQRRVLASVKNNLAAEPDALAYRLVPDELRGCARVEWLGVVEHKASGLLGPPETEEDRTERLAAADWLEGYLADQGGEAPSVDVKKAARVAGFSDSTLARARGKLKIQVTPRSGFGGGTGWCLPRDTTGTTEGKTDITPGQHSYATVMPPAVAGTTVTQLPPPAETPPATPVMPVVSRGRQDGMTEPAVVTQGYQPDDYQPDDDGLAAKLAEIDRLDRETRVTGASAKARMDAERRQDEPCDFCCFPLRLHDRECVA